MPKTAKLLTLALIFMLAACSDSDDSNASADDARDASIQADAREDAHSNDDTQSDLDGSSSDIDVDADIDGDVEETPSRAACTSEESPSDIPIFLAGFGPLSCTEFASPFSHGTITAVEVRSLVVDLDEGGSLEFDHWEGLALDSIFAVGEAVEIAVPCSYSWSVVRGETASVAALEATYTQIDRWVTPPGELEVLPAFLDDAPSFALEALCQRGSRNFNALLIDPGDDAPIRVTTPGSTQVGDWTVEFGGSEWCCADTGGEGFEAPETRSEVFLYRVD